MRLFISRSTRVDWIASIVLAGEAATIGAVCQPGAQENKTLNICVARGTCEMLRSWFINGIRLFRRRAPEECSTVHHCGGTAALAERLEPGKCFDTNTRLTQSAVRRLETRNLAAVAEDLGVSERHLRRVFREVVGLSPKMFSKLMRFERALKTAKDRRDSSCSDIAVGAGYFDQAHLIADFRSIAGATPREFLAEVCSQR